MVAARYKFVQCALGLGPVKVYAGGCTIDIWENPGGTVSGLYCDCLPGNCQAKEENDDGLAGEFYTEGS